MDEATKAYMYAVWVSLPVLHVHAHAHVGDKS